MKYTITTLLILLFISCSEKNKKGNMIVQGKIEGLNKGTLYLQKKVGDKIIAVDSTKLFDKKEYTLTDNVSSPEIYYLNFNKDKYKTIMFFGEQGTITINDEINKFGWKPEVKGSKNHELLEKYKKINNQFKMKNLDFIAKDLEIRAKKDTSEIKNLNKLYLRMIRNQAAYSIQFALNNKDHEIAPYIAMTELNGVNFIYIDSINKSLSEKVKNSTYGKQLQMYVNEVKEEISKNDITE